MIGLWIIALITPGGKAAFYARQLNIMNLWAEHREFTAGSFSRLHP